MTCNTYCGTHGCNQGPDCVARKTREDSGRVAKIGRKYHGQKPLVGTTAWRRQLRALACAMLMCLAVMCVSALTVVLMK